MKTLCAFVLFFVSFYSFSQINFGVKAGLNFSTTKFEENIHDFKFTEENGTGFHVGSFVDLALNTHFHAQTEVLYSREGVKDQFVDYINIPLIGKWYPIPTVYIGIGPQLSILANTESYKDNFENILFGALFEAGVEINHFVFDVRYILGISNSVEMPIGVGSEDNLNNITAKAKSNNFQLSVAYKF
ncbi:outer membrane beta-barrel protein [Zunongwangia endophytica]|uniref:Outer membrane beta-barrel protein n=1 Tax=Zunongwangia endophytica TaxID=1808945 RepID=A0ABV8H6D2_9FLAO|nr:outer membrane beta-barrel protein [Zunongwangia endophytica]MDN3596022.1 outer membrane beta-barrel protein [Zunongwangia endophytica]